MEIFKAVVFALAILLSYKSIELVIGWHLSDATEPNYWVAIASILWGVFYYLN